MCISEVARSKSSEEDIRWPKTLWDWLQILVAPAAIALGVYWLNTMQSQRQREAEEQRRQREQDLENQRRQREQAFEHQRTQDTALQAYLDQMGRLLLEQDLYNAPHGSSSLARAYTLTTLERVNPTHKRSIVRFLFDAELITAPYEIESVIILFEADLSQAALSGMLLAGINLGGANLRNADLSNTQLCIRDSEWPLSPADNPRAAKGIRSSTFDQADLRGADLRDAQMAYCSFRGAKLRGADLRGTNLRPVRYLYSAQLEKAIGDQNTRIHEHVERPEAWNLTYEEQIDRLKEDDSEGT